MREGTGSLHWCNDALMNEYLSMIQKKLRKNATHDCLLLSTFFLPKSRVDMPGLKRWIDKALKNQNRQMHQINKVVAPVHYSKIHWALLVVDFSAQTITAEDSQGLANTPEFWHAADQLLRALDPGPGWSAEWLQRGQEELTHKLLRHYIKATSKATSVKPDAVLKRMSQTPTGSPDTTTNALPSQYNADQLSALLQGPVECIWNTEPDKWNPSPDKRISLTAAMRARCVTLLGQSAASDSEFCEFLGLIHMANLRVNKDSAEASDEVGTAKAYIQHMAKDTVWGDHVELNELARNYFMMPMMIYEHGGNQFKLTTHIGKNISSPLAIILLRTGGNHYSLLIPSGRKAYENINACALRTVEFQPLPLMLPYGPGLMAYDCYNVPGDGNCMFAALALWDHARLYWSEQEQGSLRITRQPMPGQSTPISKVAIDGVKSTAANAARKIASTSMTGLFDESTPGTATKIANVWFQVDGRVGSNDCILDAGAGILSFSVYIADLLRCIVVGVEQEPVLQETGEKILEDLSNRNWHGRVATQLSTLEAFAKGNKFDNITHVHMWHGGTP